MPSDCISYQESGYFSKLMIDYLNEVDTLKPLYHRFPRIENFKDQILEKQADFRLQNRMTLVEALTDQYVNFSVSTATKNNLALLQKTTTFTVTTGHQLNLFTGPLYFLYKIISVINLSKELKKEYPEYDFVPVYWMATEDHDFEEIHYFNYEDLKFQWNKHACGPVGRLDTQGLDKVFEAFSSQTGIGKNADQLREWFEKSYIKHPDLASATRYLANELFKEYGLVILDGDDKNLKHLFAPYAKKELEQQCSIENVSKSFDILSNYNIQVNPREINLFYIENGIRERIVYENERYQVNNTDYSFSQEEIENLIDSHPEKISPNVILRPLYQEIILPNLCYVGGGGELAYWLELKEVFADFKVPFPILLLRNSVLLATEKQANKADRLGLKWSDLFMKKQALLDSQTQKRSENTFDFQQQTAILEKQFSDLKELAKKTDASFIGAVEAQEKKQLKGLKNLEKRLLTAEKKIHRDALERITDLQAELFPSGNLQERIVNFSQFYKEVGNQLIPKLIDELHPLEQKFNIVIL
ncbi:bacillithiol biosynthesis cysteine-adding enzyme BshC [Paenimyroides ceti]